MKSALRVALVAALVAAFVAPATGASAAWQPLSGPRPTSLGFSALSARSTAVPHRVPSLGVRPLSTTGDIPGAALPPSPVTGALDSTTGIDDDVYYIDLVEGDVLYASLTGDAGTYFSLWLFGPGSTSVMTSPPLTANFLSYPCGILWYAKTTGRYYLNVDAYGDAEDNSGAGNYSLKWVKGPDITVTSKSTTVSYGKSAPVSGRFTDDLANPIVGEYMRLFRLSGNYFYLTSVAPVKTDANGAFSFNVAPSSKTTYIMSVDQGGGADMPMPNCFANPPVTITPRVYLTAPKPAKTMYHGKTTTTFGYLKPRHTKGQKTVTIRAYHKESGKWVLRRTSAAVNYNYSSYTKYSVGLNLTKKGSWKLIASTKTDSGHASTVGPIKYVTVR